MVIFAAILMGLTILGTAALVAHAQRIDKRLNSSFADEWRAKQEARRAAELAAEQAGAEL